MAFEQLPVKRTFIHFEDEEPVHPFLLTRSVTCPDHFDCEASTAVPSAEQSEHGDSDDQVLEMDATRPFHSLCEFNPPDATPEHYRQSAQLPCDRKHEEDRCMMDNSHSIAEQGCFVPAPCAPMAPLEQGMCPPFVFNGGIPMNLPSWSDTQSAPLTNEVMQVRETLEMPASADDEDSFTTVMLRNLPNNMTREGLLEMLRLGDFDGSYDLVYLPMDFKRDSNLGYAFVNFVSPASAQRARSQYSGYQQWSFRSEKVCKTAWSIPEQQGYAKNVERFRNSPVMHNRVPDRYKPVVFSQGRQVQFPSPTKKLSGALAQKLKVLHRSV